MDFGAFYSLYMAVAWSQFSQPGCVREITLSLAIPQSKHVPKLLQNFVSDRTYSSDVSVNGCSGFFQPKKPGDIVQGRYDGQHTLAPGQVQKVSALRLDSVVNEDVLLWHLDTEGFEPRVLASAEAILSTKKVQNVIAEFRPSRFANTGTAAGEAQQIYSRFIKLQNWTIYDLKAADLFGSTGENGYDNALEYIRSQLSVMKRSLNWLIQRVQQGSDDETDIWLTNDARFV